VSDECITAMNEYKKELRQKNLDTFEGIYLSKLKARYQVELSDCYIIKTEIYGDLKFYPKANSIYFPKTKTWLKKYALNWIKKKLI
jgi:hypothetical protein